MRHGWVVRVHLHVQAVFRGHKGRKKAQFARLMREVEESVRFRGAQAMQSVFRCVVTTRDMLC